VLYDIAKEEGGEVKDMKADALNLAATLDSPEVDFYTIPQYQRPYTWETEHYETLWEDLMDAYQDYMTASDSNLAREYYFLGPVVFVKNTEKRSYDIIDGQQRTTTIHIILWYLYRKLTDEIEKARILKVLTFLGRDAKLKVSAKDKATYLKIRESNDEIIGSSRMAACANYFRGKLSGLADPESFAPFLREYVQFIVIVADDYNKAWDLFIGINGKGEPLNPTDLVKAFVCGRSDVGDDVGAIWEEKILPLKDASTAYLLFLARFKGNKLVSENSLFKEISRQFPQTIRTIDISDYSELFYRFWMKPVDQIPDDFQDGLSFTSEAKKALRVLRDLGRKDFTTLIFKYSEAFGQKSIFEEAFLKLFASYQIRMAISRKRSRERKFVTEFKDDKFISDVVDGDTRSADEKKAEDKKAALDRIRAFLKSDAADDTTLEQMTKLADYSNYPARIVLLHHEEGERGNKTIPDFQLEHLMPRTGTAYWYAQAGTTDDDAYATIVNNIGNLFVIDPTTNNEVKNKEFSVKKDFYQKKLQGWSIQSITADKTAWVQSDINSRAQKIASWAVKYWGMT
jgi:hypothetical protein